VGFGDPDQGDAGILVGWSTTPHALANAPSVATLSAPPMKRRRDQRRVAVFVTILGTSMVGSYRRKLCTSLIDVDNPRTVAPTDSHI
jgi:hypothetical protein